MENISIYAPYRAYLTILIVDKPTLKIIFYNDRMFILPGRYNYYNFEHSYIHNSFKMYKVQNDGNKSR